MLRLRFGLVLVSYVFVLLPAFGFGAIVEIGTENYDEETGIFWLDWTETVGRSYEDVSGKLDSEFDAYRYATVAELHELFMHAGLSYDEGSDSYGFNTAGMAYPYITLSSQLGDMDSRETLWASYACTGEYGAGMITEAYVFFYWNAGRANAFTHVETTTLTTGTSAERGHALVRGAGSPVPEPSTLATWSLLALCGMGIGWWRRRKSGRSGTA